MPSPPTLQNLTISQTSQTRDLTNQLPRTATSQTNPKKCHNERPSLPAHGSHRHHHDLPIALPTSQSRFVPSIPFLSYLSLLKRTDARSQSPPTIYNTEDTESKLGLGLCVLVVCVFLLLATVWTQDYEFSLFVLGPCVAVLVVLCVEFGGKKR